MPSVTVSELDEDPDLNDRVSDFINGVKMFCHDGSYTELLDASTERLFWEAVGEARNAGV